VSSTGAAQVRSDVKRSPLAQLLHALNQPLTGLQCSMEVALAVPRTPEQYANGLRENLVLTERMRALVGAMREIVDIDEGGADAALNTSQASDLEGVLREVVRDLEIVAEARNVRVELEFARGRSCYLNVERAQLGIAMMQILDSALSLAARGTVLKIQLGMEENAEAGTKEILLRVQWRPDGARFAFSRPELGLLIAQVRLERWGSWERNSADGMEALTARLRAASLGNTAA
jgi:signal transduction histidine kinase